MAASVAALAASVAHADVAVLTATRDNTIFNNGNSNGSGDSIFSGRVGNFGGQVVQRGLLRFDVADGLPAGSTVLSASVRLSLIQASAMGIVASHGLHRVDSDWGEGASIAFSGTGAAPMAGDATWTHTFFADQFWMAAGGDYDPTPSSSRIVGTTLGNYTWPSTPQLVADVQSMLDDPSSDFGWMLIGDEVTPHSAKKFGSKDIIGDDFKPMLIVEFAGPPCPWDCGDGDGTVGINDFLALLGQWGSVGTSCDLGVGAPGVDIDEFLDLLANWGPCP